jgi:O-antigen ligase
MDPLPFAYSLKRVRPYLFPAVTASFIGVGLVLWSPAFLAIVPGAFFVAVFVSNRTFRWMAYPTVLIFNQFIIANAGFPLLAGGLAIQPIDWMALFLVGTVFLKQILTARPVWTSTGLEFPVWIFLAATALSLMGAPDLKAGVVNWGHHLLYFAVFFAMVADWKDVPWERIWRVYFFWAALAAASALWDFFVSGGERSLGFSRLVLPAAVIPVLCFELARLSSDKAGRWWLAVFFVVTAVAAQTRGLWMSTGILFIVWLFSGRFLKPFRLVAAQRVAGRFFQLAAVLLLIFLLLVPFLEQVERRAEQLAQKGGTVYLRLFLWGVAWRLFLDHPVTGIGMGQFTGTVGQYPEMKNLAVFEWTHGLSAHNLPLTFLAETGLAGALTFLFLLFSIVRFAWRGAQKTRTEEEFAAGWGFFLIFTVFALWFIFAGVWDYYFTFFLALLAIFARQLKTRGEAAGGR